MIRPSSWVLLPYRVKELLAENASFDYVPCEGSRAEEVDKILNGYYDDYTSHNNYYAMTAEYNRYSDEELKQMIIEIVDSLRNQADTLMNYVNKTA